MFDKVRVIHLVSNTAGWFPLRSTYSCYCTAALISLLQCFTLLCSILIIVQRDATQNSLFIILQVHSTCFGCQPHQSSGVHKTVTTASDTGHIICSATSLQRGQAWLRWSLFIILQVNSTCFGCQPHPSSGVHKTGYVGGR